MSETQDIEELRQRVEQLEEQVERNDVGVELVEAGIDGLGDEYFITSDPPVATIRKAVGFVDSATDGRGAAEELVIEVAHIVGFKRGHTEEYLDRLRRHGEIYEPAEGAVKIT